MLGMETDGRQASGQLAFIAFHKPFTPSSSPYPHSVILLSTVSPSLSFSFVFYSFLSLPNFTAQLMSFNSRAKNMSKFSYVSFLHVCACVCACNVNTRPAGLTGSSISI